MRFAGVFTGVLAMISTLGAAGMGAFVARWDDGGTAPVMLEEPHVVVLKARRVLHLFDGDRLVRSYPIDLGTAPLGTKRRKDDGRTPLGLFRVVSKRADSEYHRFLGINYPSGPAVEWGLAKGLVSPGEAVAIRAALANGRCPSWTTALGGGVGIHGRRIGRDWTGGCIALSDCNVEELFSVLRIGDPVEILP
jgi:murein L,D-transpeptidase YafK